MKSSLILALLALAGAAQAAEYNCIVPDNRSHTFSVSTNGAQAELCSYDKYNVQLQCVQNGLKSINKTDLMATIEWAIPGNKTIVLMCREVKS